MDFRIHRRPWAVVFAILALAVVAVGCGKNRVTVDVDVTSFIDESKLSDGYQSPVAVQLSVDLDPIEVNLMEGSQDFAKAEELSIDVGIRYDNETGDGDASFTVYFGDTPEGVFNTPPVATIPASLISASVTDAAAHFDADERVIDLFTQERVYMGLRFNYNPTSLEPLQGIYTITSLTAHVVSNVEIF